MVFSKKFTIVEWHGEQDIDQDYTTTVGVCKSQLILNRGGARKADADLWSKARQVRKRRRER